MAEQFVSLAVKALARKAWEAGFDHSGEGYNGEYFRGNPALLAKAFEDWWFAHEEAQREADYGKGT